ncbi:MAG: apolipoprotein N-acyltransferase [Pseudomonadota bacterium]
MRGVGAGGPLQAMALGLHLRLTSLSGWRRIGAAFLAGCLGATAFAPFYVVPAFFAALIILVWLLDGARNSKRPRWTAAFTGWAFGFGYFLLGVYWVSFSMLVDADQYAWMIPFAVSGLPAYLALYPGAACALAVRFWSAGPRRLLVFAAAWSVMEFARGHVFTGFPWNGSAQVWAAAPLMAQTAAWIGAFGLGLVTVLLAAAPAASVTADGRFLRSRALLRRPLAFTFVGLGALALFGAVRVTALAPSAAEAAAPRPWVRLVQPNIAQRDKWKAELRGPNYQHLLRLTAQPSSEALSAVVWPESATAFSFSQTEWAQEAAGEALPAGATLFMGSIRYDRSETPQRYYNAVHAFNVEHGAGTIRATYDKHHLVPFGEFMPLSDLLRAIGVTALINLEGGFSKGDGLKTLRVGGAPAVSPLICYESIFAAASYAKGERPEWLAVLTNDAWFGDTSGPRQHLDQARLRAIETGLPVGRAANTGVSAMIDPFGRVTHRLPLYETGVIDAPLPAALPPTVFTAVGHAGYFALLAMTLICAGGLARERRATAN